MKRFLMLILTIGSLFAANPYDQIDPIIENAIQNHIFPGATVVVGTADSILYHKAYGTFTYNAAENIDISNSDAWPFDQDFYVILNLALGGWGGTIDDSIFPTTLEIDYVRVYQKDYAGMDQEDPGEVSNLILQKSTTNTLKIMWNKANDDIMIKEYLVYVNNILMGTTSLNAFLIEGLNPNTTYNVSVVAVDFADNQSEKLSVEFQTENN